MMSAGSGMDIAWAMGLSFGWGQGENDLAR
jgi:hypothetical protein